MWHKITKISAIMTGLIFMTAAMTIAGRTLPNLKKVTDLANCPSGQACIDTSGNMGVSGILLPGLYTIGTLPAAASSQRALAVVSDGTDNEDCTTGGGSTTTLCFSNGSAWASVFVAGSGTDDQVASEVPNTPAGNISGTDVQAAINELDTEKQAILTGAVLAAIVEAFLTHTEALTDVIYIIDAAGNSYKTTIDDLLGLIADGHIPAAIARDTEITAAITSHESTYEHSASIATQAELDSHAGAADPHTGYMLESNIGTGANNYVQLNGSGQFPAIDGSLLTNLPGGGDITSILDDDTGAVPIFYQAFSAIADGDTTPDVGSYQHYRTANTGSTTISDFDGSMLSDGRLLILFINDANTIIDLTSSGIEAGNRSTDYTCNNGDLLLFAYSTTDNQWHALNIPDAVSTVSGPGLVALDGSNNPYARTMTGTGLAVVTNGDGASGAPDVAVTAADASGVNTGTSTTTVVTPGALSGSTYGTVFVTLRAHEPGTALATGDGKDYWTVPPELNGWNLVSVFGAVYTVSSSGLPTFQIHNLTDVQDMLSTALTIDASEFNSSTAATPVVINTSYDDVATGDRIRLDCDASGTGTTGGDVILGFRLP